MGRQHTIYMSDKTWAELESLKKDGKSMSDAIRTAIAVCAANAEQFDLMDYQMKKIAAMRRLIDTLTGNLCKSCQAKFWEQGIIE